MPRDPKAVAVQRLLIAKGEYDVASRAKVATRELLNAAMVSAHAAGISKAEIARAVESSPQRVGQIIAETAEA